MSPAGGMIAASRHLWGVSPAGPTPNGVGVWITHAGWAPEAGTWLLYSEYPDALLDEPRADDLLDDNGYRRTGPWTYAAGIAEAPIEVDADRRNALRVVAEAEAVVGRLERDALYPDPFRDTADVLAELAEARRRLDIARRNLKKTKR